MWNLERSDWIAIVGSLAAGLVYGLLHGAMVNAPYEDPLQPDPGFAALGSFMLGIIVGVIVLVLVAFLGARLRRPGRFGCLSGVATAGLFVAGWILGVWAYASLFE